MQRPRRAYASELAQFHAEDYVDFLARITPETAQARAALARERVRALKRARPRAALQQEHLEDMRNFNLGEDCPIFEGLFDFCQLYTGGSLDGAVRLNHDLADIAINWSGGLHHAKKREASGFCYINDLVLAILELLKKHARVLYIDIDIHHGDGVEEAFWLTDRVMTVSFHKYGNFFPGTGDLKDVGASNGRYYSVNVPLNDGMDDSSYQKLFKPIISKVMEMYRPGAIVLQCGADSLASDRLGCFNLSLDGHAECVRFVKSFGIPLLVTGGGGYTKQNVARCWAMETGVLLDRPMKEDIPPHQFYYEYYADADYKLKVYPHMTLENQNTRTHLNNVKTAVLEHLRMLEHAPGVSMHELPPEHLLPELDDDEWPDQRYGRWGQDREVARDDEYYEDDKDQDKTGR